MTTMMLTDTSPRACRVRTDGAAVHLKVLLPQYCCAPEGSVAAETLAWLLWQPLYGFARMQQVLAGQKASWNALPCTRTCLQLRFCTHREVGADSTL